MKIDVFDRQSGAFVRQTDDAQLARLLREQGRNVAWHLTSLEFGAEYRTEGFVYRRATAASLWGKGLRR